MIEFKNKILFDKINILNFFKNFDLPIYLYDYKKIIQKIYILKKMIFFVFYSIKSNDNIFLLKIIYKTLSKFDIVSIGELKKIILISKKKPLIVFSGSGKTLSELIISLNFKIFCINIESFQEFFKIFYLMKIFKKKIKIMIRINPNIDAKTHKKITTGTKNNKFGISIFNLKNLFLISKILNYNFLGYDFHIGSQINIISPFKKLFRLIFNLNKIKIYKYLDIGGGLASNYYENNNVFNISKFYNKIFFLIKKNKLNYKIILELGRKIFCNSCIILSKVNYIKINEKKIFSILNLGMNDIMRPSLYNSFHKIESNNKGIITNFFFGPICESSDKFISKKIKIKVNSLIFFYSCGSYCKVMSNNYNSKKKIFELIIYNNKIKIIFKIEKFSNLINNYV